jgi:hypothetical protein
MPGIKIDIGINHLAPHPGEKVTEGLDGLPVRLQGYARMGARFAKWCAVIAIGDGLPSIACIGANAHALARCAALCQEAGLVKERGFWKQYMGTYEAYLSVTSADQAPRVPADDKENARLIVSRILLDTLADLNMVCPVSSDERRSELLTIRKELTE